MQRLFVISNMYPSHSHPYYGNFVKIIITELEPYFSVSRQTLSHHSGTLFKFFLYIGFYVKSIQHLLSVSSGIVYCHYPSYCLPVIWFCLLFKRGKLVLNFHGSDLNTKSKIAKLQLDILSKSVHRAALIIVPSEHFRQKVMGEFPRLESCKLFLYPSGGIDTSVFRPTTTNKAFDFIYVSSVNPRKGFSVFITALENLKSDFGHNPQVCVIGQGDSDYISRVLNHSTVADQVKYMGMVEHTSLPKYLNASKYFVFPTLYQESLGLVCLEAMSCGLPVIASEIDATKEYIEEGKNGFLFEQYNHRDLARVMKKSLEILDYKTLSKNALNVAATYSRDEATRTLVERLQDL